MPICQNRVTIYIRKIFFNAKKYETVIDSVEKNTDNNLIKELEEKAETEVKDWENQTALFAVGVHINEVMDKYKNGTNSEKTQNELRTITKARFNTLDNLKSLKSRVDKELLKDSEDVKSDLAQLANYIYTVYNENILLSMTATLQKENADPKAKYECHEMDGYILTNKFFL